MKFRWKPKHSVWEQKGEGYRIYGSGGWSWHCKYKHKLPKRTKTEKRTDLHKLLQTIKKKKGPSYVRDSRLNVIQSATDDYENMTLLHSPESDSEDKESKATLVKRPAEIMKLEENGMGSFGYKNRNCKWSSKTRLKIVNECPQDLLETLSDKKPDTKSECGEKENVAVIKYSTPTSQNEQTPRKELTQCTPTTNTDIENSDSTSFSSSVTPSTPKRDDTKTNCYSPSSSSKNIELPETPISTTIKFPEVVNGTQHFITTPTVHTTPSSTIPSDSVSDTKPFLKNAVPNQLSPNNITSSSEEKSKTNISLSMPETPILSSPASIISGTPLPNTNKVNIIQGVKQVTGNIIPLPSLKTMVSNKMDVVTTGTSHGLLENKPKVVKVSTKLPISAGTDPQKLLQILNSGNNFSIMKALEAAGIKAPAGKLLAIRTSAGNFVLKAGEKNVQAQSPMNVVNNVASPSSITTTPITQTTPVAKSASLSSNATFSSLGKHLFLNQQKDFLSRAERKIKSMHNSYKTPSSLLETESNRLSKQRVGVKGLFSLQKHPLRRLARGNYFKEAHGFKYHVKSASPWPKSIPRPTFRMAWRYFVSKAKRYSTIAHMLRILHASIDWEIVNDQPTKGVKRVITSNKGL